MLPIVRPTHNEFQNYMNCLIYWTIPHTLCVVVVNIFLICVFFQKEKLELNEKPENEHSGLLRK